MALPEDFNKIYGSTATGGLTPISDVNYAKGWEFVGANPPTKNDFSYLQNLSDRKSQWLYSNKLQRSDPFGDIKSDGTVETALANLSLGEAAKRDVGSGASQIPDMSSFQSGDGWFKLPSGYVIQAFEASFDANGRYINFPIPFPSSVTAIVPGVLMSSTTFQPIQFISIQRDPNDLTRFFAKYNTGGMNASYFIAIGR